jgi:glycosyltransferase involved in cell wall biosynthesis
MGQIMNVMKDSENGLLVPAGDVNALVDAINKLISDPDLRARLGRQARDDAVRNHSWESFVSRLECVFDAVIAN